MRSLSSVRVKWWGQASAVTRDAAALALADQLDGAGGRDVLDVQPAAGDLGQADVAGDHDVLGRGGHAAEAQPHRLEPLVHHAADGQLGHLAVLHDHAVEHLGVLECPAHQRGRGDRRAVVGEGDRAAGDQLAELGQLLALAALADRADRDRRWPAVPAGAWRTTNSAAAWVSIAGRVLGMQATEVTPPASAAAAPVAIVSSSSLPGSRRWTWTSISPGQTIMPRASMTISASS